MRIRIVLCFAVLFLFAVPDVICAKTAHKGTAYKFDVVPDGNTCGITEIQIRKSKGISELKIPGKINGRTVVSIGKTSGGTAGSEGTCNVFGMYMEMDGDGWSGTSTLHKRVSKIRKVIVPDSVKEIGSACFAGMGGLKKVKLSQKLTSIQGMAFADTPRLKTLSIPANVKEGVEGLTGERWNHFTVSEQNRHYKTQEGLLLSRDGRTLYGLVSAQKTVRVPGPVRKITSNAFYGAHLKKLYLGKNVKKLEPNALSTDSECKVSVAKANAFFQKAGNCIYTRKDRELAAGLSVKGVLRISQKVRNINGGFSIMGRRVKKMVIPKSVQKIGYAWREGMKISQSCEFITGRDYWNLHT